MSGEYDLVPTEGATEVWPFADVPKLIDMHEAWKIPPPDMVGKLPKGKNKEGVKNVNCNVCGGWHQPHFVHLDYMGHADVTEVLLREDPLWDWEPFGIGPDGLPAISKHGDGCTSLWIRLTVHGKTRIGVGTLDKAQSAKESAPKELLGDAFRNTAMKFGIGLSLWSKSEWQPTGDTDDGSTPEHDAGKQMRLEIDKKVGALPPEQKTMLREWCEGKKLPTDAEGRRKVADIPEEHFADFANYVLALEEIAQQPFTPTTEQAAA